jgi:acyl carrier protein
MTDQAPPTFADFADFVREKSGESDNFLITVATLFEDELGITGDDGTDLLEAVEKEYDISLEPVRDVFGLQPNEYLFQGEGFGPIDFQELGRIIRNLFSTTKEPKPIVRAFRVGELYDAVCRLMAANP